MKVIFDALVAKPGLGGIATYISGLAGALGQREDVDLYLLTSFPPRLDNDAVKIIAAPAAVQNYVFRQAWREANLPGIVRRVGADIVLSSTIELNMLRRTGVPGVLTVHDVGPWEHRRLYGGALWLRYATALPPTLRRADHVLCDSHATRESVESKLGRRLEACSVVPLAPRPLPPPGDLPPEAQGPFVLSVGAMLRHKNVETLVAAFNDDRLAGYALILTGPLNDEERDRFEAARGVLDQPERVHHLGFVPSPVLSALYVNAAAVAIPSLHEGFGLPALEAMQVGCPVVTADLPVFREIGKDAIDYVDRPLDASRWAETLDLLLRSPGRGARGATAREVAAHFSWEASAEQVWSVLSALT